MPLKKVIFSLSTEAFKRLRKSGLYFIGYITESIGSYSHAYDRRGIAAKTSPKINYNPEVGIR